MVKVVKSEIELFCNQTKSKYLKQIHGFYYVIVEKILV
jgi:hypothetical protein